MQYIQRNNDHLYEKTKVKVMLAFENKGESKLILL